MKKYLTLACALTLLAGCAQSARQPQAEEEPAAVLTGTYTRFVQGDDWGAGVSRIDVTLDSKLDSLSADDLTVKETRVSADWGAEGMPLTLVTNERTITDAYLTDSQGNKTSDASATFAVELYISPSEGNAFTYEPHITRNEWSPYKLDITSAALTSEGKPVYVSISAAPSDTKTSVDEFAMDTYTASDGTEYGYAYYEPENESKTVN